jgi:hypothetical protein
MLVAPHAPIPVRFRIAFSGLTSTAIGAIAVVGGGIGAAMCMWNGRALRPRKSAEVKPLKKKVEDFDRVESANPFTLMTLATPGHAKDGAGRFAPPGEIVLSSGRGGGAGASSIPIVGGWQVDSTPVRSQIDRVLFERLDEYKSLRPREGCVLVVTETKPADAATTSLNGAVAALNLARMVAAARDIPTLLIDCGSPAWSRYPEARGGAEAPDVLAFPNVSGLYEIIENNIVPDGWVILEDDLPSLMALAPGRIPQDWRDQLRSDGARRALEQARKIAAFTVVYAPRCCEHPEIVRALGSWSNGIMIVSGVDPASEASEAKALALLRSPDITVFGRIALLDDGEASASTPASTSKDAAVTTR